MPRAAMKTPRPSALRRVKFGDIAINVNDRVDSPSEAGVERYVGLEHLDPESLKIRRWGSPSDVEATKLLFRKGDIIFGRRRAYQRKLAVADFDGICSAHAMVLRARPDVVLPEFLPFFMQSDAFMERALAISVGSLSPTINWKTLAQEEFALPPPEEQRRMAAALLAARAVVEATSEALAAHRALELAHIEEAVQKDMNSARTIEDLVAEGVLDSPQDGNHGEKHPKARDFVESGIPFLMAADIRNGRIDLVGCKFIPKRLADSLRIGFSRAGDVLLTHKGTVGESAIVPALDCEYVMLTPQVTYYRPNTKRLLPAYLRSVFRSTFFQQQLRAYERQSTRAYVGITAQRRLRITCPPLKRQRDAVSVFQELTTTASALEARSRASTQLLVFLRERLVPGGI